MLASHLKICQLHLLARRQKLGWHHDFVSMYSKKWCIICIMRDQDNSSLWWLTPVLRIDNVPSPLTGRGGNPRRTVCESIQNSCDILWPFQSTHYCTYLIIFRWNVEYSTPTCQSRRIGLRKKWKCPHDHLEKVCHCFGRLHLDYLHPLSSMNICSHKALKVHDTVRNRHTSSWVNLLAPLVAYAQSPFCHFCHSLCLPKYRVLLISGKFIVMCL